MVKGDAPRGLMDFGEYLMQIRKRQWRTMIATASVGKINPHWLNDDEETGGFPPKLSDYQDTNFPKQSTVTVDTKARFDIYEQYKGECFFITRVVKNLLGERGDHKENREGGEGGCQGSYTHNRAKQQFIPSVS